MTKICHMSSAHNGLDVRIFNKECASLACAGYETHLVISASRSEVEQAATADVRIHSLPTPKGRLARMLKQALRCYRISRNIDADIYHFHDPELIPYGIVLRLKGKRVIYDVHEDLPRAIESKEWIPSALRGLTARVASLGEHVSAKLFSSIVTATPHIEARFKKYNARTVVVNNYPLPSELVLDDNCQRSRRRQICYVGGLARARGIESLIRALPLIPDLRLVLCGSFTSGGFKEELAALPGWKQVDYRGYVDRMEVRRIMGESIAGVVTLLPTPAYVNSLPIKMFEYMSASLPVIASDFPLWRQILSDTGAGICVDPESPEEIAAAIRKFADDPVLAERSGAAGYAAVLSKYNWPIEARRLIDVYRDLQ